MKRIITMFLAVLMVAGLATTAMARGGYGRGRNYVDADGNGVCDNYGTGCGRNYVDADGDGVCDNYGTGCGRNYVDADGDGVWDNYGTGCGRGGCRA